MSATKPADLTLAIQKATEGFIVIIDRPTDTDIVNIRQLLFPVLMKTKYNKIQLKHNLSGVILVMDWYKKIYSQGIRSLRLSLCMKNRSLKIRDKMRSIRPKSNSKQSATTVPSTRRQTRTVLTSLCKLLTRRGTRNLKTPPRSTQTSWLSSSSSTSPSSFGSPCCGCG